MRNNSGRKEAVKKTYGIKSRLQARLQTHLLLHLKVGHLLGEGELRVERVRQTILHQLLLLDELEGWVGRVHSRGRAQLVLHNRVLLQRSRRRQLVSQFVVWINLKIEN